MKTKNIKKLIQNIIETIFVYNNTKINFLGMNDL